MLKDLVLKEINHKSELSKLEEEWAFACDSNEDFGFYRFYFNNAEQIAKEKAEILNKPIEYTKQEIIDMFVNAGLEYCKNSDELIFEINNVRLRLCFGLDYDFWFKLDVIRLDDNVQSVKFNYNDTQSIIFYYNKFREILEFEINKDNQ